MKFIEILLENSEDKFAKLYKPAYKANQNPENGITIHNKSAFHVIKDCAYIAHLYLPIYCFEKYSAPFLQLKGKFKRPEIEEFVQSTKTQNVNAFLLNLILQKIEEKEKKQPVEKFANDLEPNDPYGEYGLESDTRQYVNQYSKLSDDSLYLVNMLCDKFGVSN